MPPAEIGPRNRLVTLSATFSSITRLAAGWLLSSSTLPVVSFTISTGVGSARVPRLANTP